jgi:hypothetical protein
LSSVLKVRQKKLRTSVLSIEGYDFSSSSQVMALNSLQSVLREKKACF